MNSVKKYRYGFAVCGAFALVAAGACTPSGDDGDEMVWAVGGAEAQSGGVHQSVVDLWNEENPDRPVRIETLPEDADSQREQHALELQSQGTSFDILGVDVVWTGEYTENDWLESLEDVRGDLEGASLEGPFESALWNDELWAAPYNSNAGFLYYRTDLVDEPPQTWEEMCDTAESVGDAEGINGFVGQGASYEGMVVNWLEYYWSGGGELYNEDQSEVVFDDELAVETTEWMADAVDDCFGAGFNTATEEEASNEFQEGNAVFMRNWPYVYGEVQGDEDIPVHGDFEVAPLPTFTGEGTISALGGFNNAVSAFSENTEDATDFVVWAATDPGPQTLLAEAAVPPTMESIYDDFQDDPVMAQLSEVLPDAKPRPPAPGWNEISVTMQNELHPAYNGEADIDEAVANVRAELEASID